ncbi:MAG: SBBP repeat-containing protein [candidate division WOR-3 bacterium]
MISFVSAMGGNVVNSYDPSIIKEWLNSYPYLYKGFTPNKGQLATIDGKIAENVVFYSRNGNMGIFITENGMSYVIYDIEKKEVSKDNKEPSLPINKEPENSILHYSRIDYELIGGKIKKENIIYQDELPGYENFYLAHCPDGILFVKSYRKVIIKDIYPGIDWIFRYDDNGNFHHEFEIKNPQLISQIKLRVKYADIELTDNSKSIILSTPIGKIKDGNLIGYQGNNIVEVSYRLKENNLLTFEAIDYDKNKSLLIDPYALVWGTYYGGSNGECFYLGCSITTDANANVFVAGATVSTNFPTQPSGSAYYQSSNAGPADAFILKFNNLGVLLWATYYGGNRYDHASSITTDAIGNVFVTGRTYSPIFPTYDNGTYYDSTCGTDGNCNYDGTLHSDVFILRFDNSGVRQWATYYGGSNDDKGRSIITDTSGNVFVIGWTLSPDFPTQDYGGGAYYDSTCGTDGNCNFDGTNYYSDAFISEFSGASSPIYENTSHYYYKDKLTLNLKSVSSPITIKIYSLDGKLIYSNIFKTNNIEINLKGLKAGIYILKAYSKNNKQLTYKFVKS